MKFYIPFLFFVFIQFIGVVWAHGLPPLVPNQLTSSTLLTPKISLPRPKAAAVLLRELHSGKDLFELRADQRLAPASLTKILSALVILESGKLDEPVTISKAVTKTPRTRLGVRRGDVFVLRDLLKAMLLTSANDACLAAANHVGGSEQHFVQLMNEYVSRLHLQDTVFSNACGFDASHHYSTARDLAVLTEAALHNPLFQEIIEMKDTTIRSIKQKRRYALKNTNRLLQSFPGVEGVKTGYTALAGRCLIVKARTGKKEILLVLLNAKRRWKTATNLLRYGLDLSNHSDLAPITKTLGSHHVKPVVFQ